MQNDRIKVYEHNQYFFKVDAIVGSDLIVLTFAVCSRFSVECVNCHIVDCFLFDFEANETFIINSDFSTNIPNYYGIKVYNMMKLILES